ncbi:uncharacterized protein LOC110837232 isoform X2 [Zootermopsis nevadensis]|uniref:uncharacterized protein LOC110837232 isoform X2 n=1 Tax=Zootermopsis nevadensis TaxID=136037 RepID=UPI000B8E7D0C|nr:uncharacterized protein LOC110837232 isoform X2 [Zootermopsis nevadensis]
MSSLAVSPKRRRDVTKSKFKVMGNHKEFLSRIKKTLYYGELPITERFSLPVSELAAELFSEVKSRHSLERLDLEEAAAMSRSVCVSPCSLVLALLYLERLKTCNPDYLQRVAPSELFLVSMMVASKFLHDDGEPDEVFNDEWAASAGLSVKDINHFERDFLQAIVSAVCLTSYTASVLTLIGSAFIVSQIPGTTISTSISSSTNDLPSSSVQETPIINLIDQTQSRTIPPVNVLTTSFILASLGSCPSVNDSDSSSCLLCSHDRLTSLFCEQYLVHRSDDISYRRGSAVWSELVSGWMKYVNWQLKVMDIHFKFMLLFILPRLDPENLHLDIRNTSLMIMQTGQAHILDR